ncbi:hypothetical protein F511_43012 [Dorcoceras hygrometricum]|uniref:Uncharacterized protein n=1 Tax=Dorcoceras hygrometricum TaxID=472368 RepID=A0A2Z7B1R1_9LAMI|nr:hypothetical protein F511_43012 [Dorcoceras hygrometricum]
MSGRCLLAMRTGCAMVKATARDDAPVAHRVARLCRACRGHVRGLAPHDFRGGGRRPVMLRRCRDG